MITTTTALVVGAIALLVIGPKQLPNLAKGIGKALGEFRKGVKNGEDEGGGTGVSAAAPADLEEKT